MLVRRCEVAVALMALAAMAGCGPPERSAEDESIASLGQPLGVQPGDRVELTGLGLAVIAPEPGLGVWTEAVLDTGETRTMRVQTLSSGEVFLFLAGDEVVTDDATDDVTAEAEAAGETTSSGSPGPCKDGAQNVSAWTWKKTFEWRFNAGSTPSGMSKDFVEAALKKATSNITGSRNSCGLADQVSATHAYKGHTTQGAQIGTDGSCGNGNGVNTVGFGDLPSGVLGLTCVWFDGSGEALESDMRLNKADFHWVVNIGSGCANRWSLEAVATHERGHTFGIGHVSESAHGNLTMSPLINGPCQSSEATLGLGDVKALRAKY